VKMGRVVHRLGSSWALVALPLIGLSSAACGGTEEAVFRRIADDPLSSAQGGRSSVEQAATGVGGGGAEPSLDPNVTFVWSETLPGQGTCKPGIYSGQFSCDLEDANLVTSLLSARGTVTFTLGPPTETQGLPITYGDLGGPLFRGSLSGELDCATDRLGALSSDGQAIQLDGLMGAAASDFVSFRTFTASLEGELDRATLVIEGSFQMVNNAGETCVGSFSANASP
jgi:hypothetical protein